MNPTEKLKKDLNEINEIKSVNHAIKTLYQKLAQLEIDGKMSSEEFYTIIEYLKMSKEVEQKQYQNAQLNKTKCLRWIQLLCSNPVYQTGGRLNKIIIPTNQEWAQYRVINTLHRLSKPEEEVLNLPILQCIPNDHPVISEILKDAKKHFEIQKELEQDFLKAVMFFLQHATQNERRPQIREILIQIKYRLILTHRPLEEEMIKKNFQVKEPAIIFQSKLSASALNVDLETYLELSNLFGHEIYNSQMLEWIYMNDIKEYDENTLIAIRTLRKCFVRAAFLFIETNRLEEENDTLHNYLNDHPLKYQNDITSCFRTINADRQKIISFGIPNQSKRIQL